MKINFNNLSFEDYVTEQRKFGLDYGTLFLELKRGYAPLNFDADNKTHARKIARSIKKLYDVTKCYKILFRKSPSRRGYHFTVLKNGKQLFLPIKKVLRIRRKCFDCFGRMKADKIRAKRGLPISILFNHKNLKDATMWRELKYLKDL